MLSLTSGGMLGTFFISGSESEISKLPSFSIFHKRILPRLPKATVFPSGENVRFEGPLLSVRVTTSCPVLTSLITRTNGSGFHQPMEYPKPKPESKIILLFVPTLANCVPSGEKRCGSEPITVLCTLIYGTSQCIQVPQGKLPR